MEKVLNGWWEFLGKRIGLMLNRRFSACSARRQKTLVIAGCLSISVNCCLFLINAFTPAHGPPIIPAIRSIAKPTLLDSISEKELSKIHRNEKQSKF